MRNAPVAGTSPFAHLGRSRAAAEDDQDEKDAKKAKKAKAEECDEDEPKDDEPKGKKAKKAEEQDDTDSKAKGKKAKASDEDDDEPKGKKAKKADADGDEDDEDENDPEARAARARERRRIRAIVASEPGVANPVAAMHLATGTSMPRGQAIELLAAMQAGQPAPAAASTAASATRDDLRTRMAEVPNASVGSDADRPALNTAEQIVLAGKKRRGEA